MQKFDKRACAALREDIDEALKAVAAKHGIEVRVLGATYTSGVATFKVQLSAAGATREGEDFKLHAASLGMTPDMLGQSFSYQGREFTLVGYAPRARKLPMVVSSGGKLYKMPLGAVVAGFGARRSLS